MHKHLVVPSDIYFIFVMVTKYMLVTPGTGNCILLTSRYFDSIVQSSQFRPDVLLPSFVVLRCL